MTETPPPDLPPRDEPGDVADSPAWEEPAPAAQDDYQYDAWLAAEDDLHADEPEPPSQDEPVERPDEAPLGTAADEPTWTDEPDPVAAEAEPEQQAVAEEEPTVQEPAADEPVAEQPVAQDAVPEEVEAAPEAEEPAVPGEEAAALAPEPAEPGTADPTVAVAAAPLVDPVAPDAVEDVPVAQVAAPAADEDALVPTPRTGRALLAALVAVVVLLAGLTGFLAWLSHDTAGGGDVERARVEALSASRSAARVVFSYDYRHLQKDFAAGKALVTGDFAQEYARTTGKIVDDVAGRYKAVVRADVTDAAVVRASRNQVVTLVFLTQQSTSTLSASTKITQSRLEMTMMRRHGRWLVGKIRAF